MSNYDSQFEFTNSSKKEPKVKKVKAEPKKEKVTKTKKKEATTKKSKTTKTTEKVSKKTKKEKEPIINDDGFEVKFPKPKRKWEKNKTDLNKALEKMKVSVKIPGKKPT